MFLLWFENKLVFQWWLQNTRRLLSICVFCELYYFILSSVCFFMASVKLLCSIVLLPSSAILTNLTLLIYHIPNTTVLLFTVKPFCNLSLLCLSNPIWGAIICAWWNTRIMTVLHHDHGLYNFTVFFFLLRKMYCDVRTIWRW